MSSSRRSLIVAGLSAVALLTLPLTIAPAALPVSAKPNVVANDTLDFSPDVAAIASTWTPSMDPRAFCVTSYATWPRFIYLRKMASAEMSSCERAAFVFVQVPRCPTPQQLAETPPFFVIQCGPGVFQRNSEQEAAPANGRGQIA